MGQKRLCLISVSVLLALVGIFFIAIHSSFLDYVITTQMVLTPGSKAAKSWQHVPSLIPIDIYIFNWTNPQDIYNASSKPRVEEIGPYRFMIDVMRANVTWNDNGTVSFKHQKYWYFSPEGTNGSLQDVVTLLNTPALGAAHVARSWGFFVRKGISFTLSNMYSSIYQTRTVDEFLFTGYPDPLTKMASTMPVFADRNVPKWDKFGWFYKRNGSLDMEGLWNMGTGKRSDFGKVYAWNRRTNTSWYDGKCAKVEGSSGDNFKADGDTIEWFFADLCRKVVLEYVEDEEVDGIMGKKYVMGKRTVDNGTEYPENRCYCPGECTPSGIFNMSSCTFGSPTFMSMPHFFSADPYYRSLVDGLHPKRKTHEFYVIVEPRTGIPLEVNTKLQINWLLHPVSGISLYYHVPKVFFPIMWMDQKANVPPDEMFMLKILLATPTIFVSLGIVLMILGAIILFVVFVPMTRNKKPIVKQEEDVPLQGEKKYEILTKKIEQRL